MHLRVSQCVTNPHRDYQQTQGQKARDLPDATGKIRCSNAAPPVCTNLVLLNSSPWSHGAELYTVGKLSLGKWFYSFAPKTVLLFIGSHFFFFGLVLDYMPGNVLGLLLTSALKHYS